MCPYRYELLHYWYVSIGSLWIFTSVATILLEEELKFIEKVRTPLLLKEKYFRLLINRAKFGSCIKKLLFKINDITVFC